MRITQVACVTSLFAHTYVCKYLPLKNTILFLPPFHCHYLLFFLFSLQILSLLHLYGHLLMILFASWVYLCYKRRNRETAPRKAVISFIFLSGYSWEFLFRTHPFIQSNTHWCNTSRINIRKSNLFLPDWWGGSSLKIPLLVTPHLIPTQQVYPCSLPSALLFYRCFIFLALANYSSLSFSLFLWLTSEFCVGFILYSFALLLTLGREGRGKEGKKKEKKGGKRKIITWAPNRNKYRFL